MPAAIPASVAPRPGARYVALDGLRGVAAVVVLVHHALLVLPASTPSGGVRPGPVAFVTALWPGAQSVFLFFVLSGLVLAASPLRRPQFSWRAYYPSRLIRLYLPVIAAVLFAVTTVLLVPRAHVAGQSIWVAAHVEPHTLGSVLLDALVVVGVDTLNTPLWSLQWEVLFSLLLPLAVVLTSRFARRPVVAVVCLVLVSAAGLEVSVTTSGPLAATLLGAVSYLPMFVVGCILAARVDWISDRYDRLRGTRRGRSLVAALLVAALIGLCSPWTLLGAPGAVDRMLSVAIVLSATVLIVAAMTVRHVAAALSTQLARWLGRISFSLYLVHEPIMMSAGMLFPPESAWLAVAIGVPVSFLAAVLFFRFVEGPSHRLSHMILTWIRAREAVPVTV